MNPLIVVDVETTGLPGKTPPELLRIVEVGAAFVDEHGDIRRTFGEIVSPGAEIAEHPKVQDALAISGLTPELLVERGRTEVRVAKEFLCWVESLPGPRPHATAYNRDFDMGMLSDGPWRLALSGVPLAPCLMLESLKAMVEHGGPLVQKPWAKGDPPPALELLESGAEGDWYKWPRADETIPWLRERGHYIPALREHRALDDAVMEAWVAVALGKEGRS